MIAITTRFLGPTNRLGARIVAETANGHKLIKGYRYTTAHESHAAVACALARSLGWNPSTLISGELKNGYAFVFPESDQFDVATGERVEVKS